MKCPYKNCGAENANGAVFCHMCGRPLHKLNTKKWLILLAVFIVFVAVGGFSVCCIYRNAQAKTDGKSVAEMRNDCQKKYIEKIQQDRDSFINSFNCNNYKTREGAVHALELKLNNNIQKYEQEQKEINLVYDKMAAKYGSNSRRRQLFERSFHAALDNPLFNPENYIERAIKSESFLSCLTCLQPMRPDEEQVCRDLKGHKVRGSAENPFFGDSWKLVFNDNNIEDVVISSCSYKDDRWTLVINVIVKEGGHNLFVVVQAIYELSHSKESWTLIDVITDDVSIVKTSTYKKAIDVSYELNNISITNKNESPLLIGIDVWINEYEGWISRKLVLDTEKKTNICCGLREDGSTPYRIIFVEKE